MAARARGRATYQDLLEVPDRFIAELIDGELYSGHWLILQVFGGSDVVRAEPFDAVEIDLALFWGETSQEA